MAVPSNNCCNSIPRVSGVRGRRAVLRPRCRAGLPTGYAALDRCLPGAGWPRQGLIEILSDQRGIGELQLLMPVLAALCAATRVRHRARMQGLPCRRTQRAAAGWIAWVSPPYRPYAPCARCVGHRRGAHARRARCRRHRVGDGPGVALRSLQRRARLGQSARSARLAAPATGGRSSRAASPCCIARCRPGSRLRRPCCGSRCSAAAATACRCASSRAAEAVLPR